MAAYCRSFRVAFHTKASACPFHASRIFLIPSLSRCSHSTRPQSILRNTDIKHDFVQLVDNETGHLHPLASLKEILSSVDLKTHFVQLIRDNPTPIVKVFKKATTSNKRNSPRARNMDIGYPIVQLVDPKTDRLRSPTPLAHIVSSIDLKTHFVELVSESPNPIVKIISKQAQFGERKAAKAKKKNQVELKEVQMTWGVASGDLAHKLRKVRQELEKGNRVDLVYAPKKGQVIPTAKEMEVRVQETLDYTRDVGKEWKPMEVEGAITVIHLQGTSQPVD
jgi:translation initiation factor IF-3